jgi:hypothetical protein
MGDPYREPKPLRELIAPDRRRERALMLFAGGIIAGGLLVHFGPELFARYPTEIDPAPEPAPIPIVIEDKPPPVIESPATGTLGSAEILSVVAQHRIAVRRACWERQKPPALTSASVSVTIEVAPNGDVASVESQGDNALVASCVESQVRRWKFPAHAERSAAIAIPFRFLVADPL